MSEKIIPIIASVILIAIYAVLFNSSLPKWEKNSDMKLSDSISITHARNFFTALSETEKQLILVLPCEVPAGCAGSKDMKKKVEANFQTSAIKRALILDNNGIELFSNKKIDPKYVKLISSAAKTGKAFLREDLQSTEGGTDRTITVLKISDIAAEKYFDNKFILILIDNSALVSSNNKFIYGALTFIPLLAILFYLVTRTRISAEERNRTDRDYQEYIAQIDELKRLNVQQSQFLANFTHELRTPLNSIIGFSGLLKDQTLGNLGNPEYLKYSNDINISGVHLLSLINDILDYSKSEVGKLKVNITEVDVVKIIKQTMSIISPRASESKVELMQSFSSDYFILRIDPKRFKQIMLNLLSNSVKFTPEGGSVTVAVFPDIKGERISIEVKDTGVGIAEKDIPTVMSLFGQVETDLNRKYEGTGIGLPFAKKLTTIMGGTFDLNSQVGAGTTIVLTFPFDKKLNTEYQDLYNKQAL